ncbi:MAG: hypothetical protein D6683_18345 [Actinomyces sp.]|nr:MAG: hypothetical protein D6683_18345 [Actinomyces sp.]
MNHLEITRQALIFRFRMLHGDDPPPAVHIDSLAAAAIAARDHRVVTAIRRLADAWTDWGLAPDALVRPWPAPELVARLATRPDLVDALDDLVGAATRARAA